MATKNFSIWSLLSVPKRKYTLHSGCMDSSVRLNALNLYASTIEKHYKWQTIEFSLYKTLIITLKHTEI